MERLTDRQGEVLRLAAAGQDPERITVTFVTKPTSFINYLAMIRIRLDA